MFLHPRRRITRRFNTVDMDKGLTGVEIVQAVEEAFDVTISDTEAEAVRTVGDLHTLVLSKLGDTGSAGEFAKLERIVRDHTGTKDPIDEETSFLAEYAKRR